MFRCHRFHYRSRAREQVALNVQSRPEQGKGPVGQMRRLRGQLPGVIYGHNQPSESFKTDAHSLELILSKAGKTRSSWLSTKSPIELLSRP